MAFRSVTNSISSKRDQIRRILQLPPPPAAATTTHASNAPISDPNVDKDPKTHENNEDSPLEPAVQDLEEAVTAYLRRATETFDLSKNVEVCKEERAIDFFWDLTHP